jgi:hypothetical protein
VTRGLLWLRALGADLIAAPLAIIEDHYHLRQAVIRYLQQGGVLIAAAGRTHSRVAFPARYPGVIAVQGHGGPYPKLGVATEPAQDDSRAVMYYMAAWIASAQRRLELDTPQATARGVHAAQ